MAPTTVKEQSHYPGEKMERRHNKKRTLKVSEFGSGFFDNVFNLTFYTICIYESINAAISINIVGFGYF